MRKPIKIAIGIGSVLAIAAPAITVPLVLKYKERIFSKSMYEDNKKYSLSNDAISFNSASNKILDTANEADINIYFSPAVAPFNNLLRLSMLSNKENHFFLINGSDHDVFEELVNAKKLQDFYNNKRVSSEGESTVVDLHGGIASTATDALEKMHSIVDKNQDKKINIWWNDVWLKAGFWKDRVLNFAGFSNVNVQLIEDGAAQHMDVDKIKRKIASKDWDSEDTNYYNEILSPAMFPGKVRGWYSSEAFIQFNDIDGVDDESYNLFKYKELSDSIFNTRDKDGNRLMKYWPELTGLNWRHEAKMVMEANKLNGKEDLLILGSYGVTGEEDYIMNVWKRYHNQYNIFYKGHPGHMEHPLFVKREMVDKKLDSMYQLEPMIASEELTRDHVKTDSDGLHISFDKVISINKTSAITHSSLPNINIMKDVIEIYYGLDDKGELNYAVNPSQDPKSTNWDSSAEWLAKQNKI